MALYPQVRFVAEGTGAPIATVPPLTSTPVVGDDVVVQVDGGAETTYQVEKVTYYVHIVNPVSGASVGVDCYVEIEVSVA